jgi:FKBP-type peptidyl-prolyl cis-trans isomerase 2
LIGLNKALSEWVKAKKKTVNIEPSQAMGERRPELVAKFSREEVLEQFENLNVGSRVEVEDNKGNPLAATITGLTDREITIDANHPLAGKTLVFDIELIEFV